MKRILVAFLAVLGPALVVGGMWVLGDGSREWVPDELVKEHNEKLAKVKPDVVVVGPSIARTDVDEAQLGKALGMSVATLSSAGSPGALWYAILKYRVFEAGYRPKMVLVVGITDKMLQSVPDTGSSFQSLLAQSPVLDDEIRNRSFGGSGGAWERHQASGRQMMASILAGYKYGLVGLAFGREEAKAKADAAAGNVFEVGTTRNVLAQGLVPGDNTVVAADQGKAAELSAEKSYVGPIVKLGQSYGASVFFVAGPLSSSARNRYPTPPDEMRSMLELLNSLGAGWIDLRLPEFTDSLFADDVHLRRDGKKLFTQLLAEAIQNSGALEGSIAPARIPNLPSRIERIGTPPPVQSGAPVQDPKHPCGLSMVVPEWKVLSTNTLGQVELGALSPLEVLADGVPLRWSSIGNHYRVNCEGAFTVWDGKALFSRSQEGQQAQWSVRFSPDLPLRQPNLPATYWVYPDTAMRIGYDKPWTGSGLTVLVSVQSVGGRGGRPELLYADHRWPLEEGENRISLEVPKDKWEFSVASPANGPAVAVRSLGLDDGERVDWLIERNTSTIHFYHNQIKPTYESPPSLPVEAKSNEKGVVVIPFPEEQQWQEGLKKTLVDTGCWPQVAVADGVPLSGLNRGMFEGGREGYTRQIGQMSIRPPAGTQKLILEAIPNCRLQYWVYPGSVQRAVVPQRFLQQLREHLRQLQLKGWQTGPGTLQVQVKVDDAVVLSSTVDGAQLPEGVTLPLTNPVPWEAKQVELILSVPPDSPAVFLTIADLVGQLHE